MKLETASPSFEKINYVLRPRKQIERKIILEIIQEIQRKCSLPISSYSYVGLGSIYYYDFILFNKFLNIRKMVSVDNKKCVQRFNFNKPFDFITFHNIATTQYLQSQDKVKGPSIMWFDYDSALIKFKYFKNPSEFKFNQAIVDDIAIVTKNNLVNDIFIITINIQSKAKLNTNSETRKSFFKTFGPYLTRYNKPDEIVEDNLPYIVQDIVLSIFRNNESFQENKFRKLFSFCYADGSLMYTLGGMFLKKDSPNVDLKCDFAEEDESKVTFIQVPILTYREKLKLDQCVKFFEKSGEIPPDQLDSVILERLGFELEKTEIDDYLKYYRYYPQYYEGLV